MENPHADGSPEINPMCNLYSITTNQAAIIALFRVLNRYAGAVGGHLIYSRSQIFFLSQSSATPQSCSNASTPSRVKRSLPAYITFLSLMYRRRFSRKKL